MIKNYSKFVLFLFGVFLLSPYGFGISSFGLQSFDLPKLIPSIILIIVIFRYGFKKIDIVTLLMFIFVFFHFFSIFYSNSFITSLYEFSYNTILYYPAYFAVLFALRSDIYLKYFLKIVNFVFLAYIFFSITEFIFQFNFFDLIRNNYIGQETRFNNSLGIIRLGRKASMGPFPSTLPFAYTLITLYFLKDLYVPFTKNIKFKVLLLQIFGAIAVLFTLSRAAILILIFVLFIKIIYKRNIFKSFFTLFVIFSFSALFFSKIDNNMFSKYMDTYVTGINEHETQGNSSRLNNNIIDFNFAMESPFLGHGAGMLYFNKIGWNASLESSDSSFLISILADRGLISLLLLLMIIFITFKRAYFLSKIKSNIFNYTSFLYSFSAMFLCLNSSQRQEVYFLFFLLLGLINKVYILNKKNVNIYNNSNI
jgi:hypothetical protein